MMDYWKARARAHVCVRARACVCVCVCVGGGLCAQQPPYFPKDHDS